MIDRSIPSKVVLHLLRPLTITTTQSISGGLSGAQVWRCQSARHGQLCLRQWTRPHPNEQRLEWIHKALNLAWVGGLNFVPRLYTDQLGCSFHRIDDCFWEVTQWLPGEADYLRRPSPRKLQAACEALAKLHRCWRGLSCERGVSPSMCERATLLSHWLSQSDLIERIGRSVRSQEESQLCLATLKYLQLTGPHILASLQRMSLDVVSLQPVLRDVWNDHLLFEQDRLVGIVDYGALRVDETAVDLARMLGSLEPFDVNARQAAVEVYNSFSVDTPQDMERIALLDSCGTLLTAMQWMQWIVEQRRTFAVPLETQLARWQTAIARMNHLAP